MGEMQQLRERLSISERAARTEAQLKEKFQLRLKVVEHSLKASAGNGGAEAGSPVGLPVKKSPPPPPSRRSTLLSRRSPATPKPAEEADAGGKPSPETAGGGGGEDGSGDGCVSSALYDVLQKEVVCLRRACQDKDQNLRDRDGAIDVLSRKVETLTKAMEVEAKKMRREKAAMEKEVAALRAELELEQRPRRSRAPATPRAHQG